MDSRPARAAQPAPTGKCDQQNGGDRAPMIDVGEEMFHQRERLAVSGDFPVMSGMGHGMARQGECKGRDQMMETKHGSGIHGGASGLRLLPGMNLQACSQATGSDAVHAKPRKCATGSANPLRFRKSMHSDLRHPLGALRVGSGFRHRRTAPGHATGSIFATASSALSDSPDSVSTNGRSSMRS